MLTPTCLDALLDLAADVTGQERRTVRGRAAGAPFVTLGGTLQQAMRLQRRAGERLGLSLDLAALLGPAPLTEALARAVPLPAPPPPGSGPLRPLLPGQRAALTGRHGRRAAHRVLSAELSGPLDLAALRTAVAALSARHEGLRTFFVPSAGGPVRRVLEAYTVPLLAAPPASGDADCVAAVHRRLAVDGGWPAGRAGRPPVAFVLAPLAPGRHLLSFLYHRAVAGPWSAALVWRELLADYGRAARGLPVGRAPAPGPEAPELPPGGAARRAALLRDAAGPVDLGRPERRPAVFDFRGGRLPFLLDAEVRDAVDATARRAGVPHSTVVLAAWALAVGRRSGREELLVGAELPRRPVAALPRTVVPCAVTHPVRCVLEGTADYFLRGIACALSEGLAHAGTDEEELARALGTGGDRSRPGPAQVAFAAHDELLAAAAGAGGVSARFHPGHLGGAEADAALTLVRWRERPLLCLDFASSVLTRVEAARLAGDVSAALLALALSAPSTPVDDLLPAARVAGATLPSLPG
ncbi:condensation domain-containing protein [Streptomyces sp. NPDC059701]|uniref:condensation domain-containing protein n=1 Tax=Streptomyces sp. NPDC059701 TaxID=3346914 RepID=UPI0036AA6B0F